MLFSYFEFLNEGIIDREGGMRGAVVKRGETPLLGGGYLKFTQGSPSLSSKISVKNRRENQIKTRWERSGRHNKIGMECGKHKDERRCCGEMKIFKAAIRCNGSEADRVDSYIQRVQAL